MRQWLFSILLFAFPALAVDLFIQPAMTPDELNQVRLVGGQPIGIHPQALNSDVVVVEFQGRRTALTRRKADLWLGPSGSLKLESGSGMLRIWRRMSPDQVDEVASYRLIFIGSGAALIPAPRDPRELVD